LRKEVLVRQGRGREIAKDADAPILFHQFAHDLHAAEQQYIVDRGHEPSLFGGGNEFLRHDQAPAGIL
jgi:hypothetical protein